MNYLLTDDKKEDFGGPMIEEEACRIREMYAWDYGGNPCTIPTDRLIHFIIIAFLY